MLINEDIREKEIRVIGEDGKPEKGIAAAVKQDTAGQGEAAIRAAIRYVKTGIFPKRKFTCIPSDLYRSE